MKVAVAFFGQPRYVGNPQIINTYKQVLLDKYDCDVFGHMWWQEDGGEFDYSSWSKISNCPVPPDAPKIVTDNYNPLILAIEDPQTFELPPNAKKFVDEKYTDKHPDGPHWNAKNYSNVMSQLKSIQHVSKIVREYSIENNISYDFIVLARYDTVMLRFPNLEELDKYKFYLPGHHPRFPDTIQFFGPKFLTWAETAFDEVDNVYEDIWEPSPEAFKYGAFLRRFSKSDLVGLSMDAACIRG